LSGTQGWVITLADVVLDRVLNAWLNEAVRRLANIRLLADAGA